MYCPKNIDIPAYEGYLKSCIASERERYAIAIARAEAHKAGYEEGISVALEGLRCSNYEKKLDDESYRQGINDFLYELGKELGIPADRTYIRYTATTDWGWNGGNF